MSIRDLLPWSRQDNNHAAGALKREDPFLALQREINRLFDGSFRNLPPGLFARGAGISGGWPSLDISDGEKEIRVTAEMPGMDEGDIEVLLADGVLTLKGEKREEKEDEDKHYSERYYGRFERRIPLGYGVEEDKVAANFNNGVLTITLPKSEQEQAKVKRIAIGR